MPGIGEKTAAACCSAGARRRRSSRRPTPTTRLWASGAKIAAARDYLLAAVAVTRVRTDCPLPPYDDVLPAEPADAERLLELADRWGVESSVNRVLLAMRDAAAAG